MKSRGKEVVALVCADLHLSLTPPAARSNEPDWLAAQQRPLEELAFLKDKYGARVIYCGDIFDRHSPPAELINWTIKYLPDGLAIPGNHDLPLHRYGDLHKSGYWTLVEAGKLINLRPKQPKDIGPLTLHAFPCGFKVRPLRNPHDLCLEIAVVHSYIWAKNALYPNASKEQHISRYTSRLAGYDLACFGDNHIPFQRGSIWNCGTLIRRRSDEKALKPRIGIIHADGSVEPYYLDVLKDEFLDKEDKPVSIDTSAFLYELTNLADKAIDFGEALRHSLGNGVSKEVKEIALRALDTAK